MFFINHHSRGREQSESIIVLVSFLFFFCKVVMLFTITPIPIRKTSPHITHLSTLFFFHHLFFSFNCPVIMNDSSMFISSQIVLVFSMFDVCTRNTRRRTGRWEEETTFSLPESNLDDSVRREETMMLDEILKEAIILWERCWRHSICHSTFALLRFYVPMLSLSSFFSARFYNSSQ